MQFLKQATASQAVLLGPFIDDTDGKTAETGLTIANTDIRLSKNGGNMAAKNSGGGTHDEAGWYTVTFDATDSDTVGRLQASVDVSGALPVWAEFQVVEEDVYEFLLASGSSPDADIAAILEDTAVIGALGAGLTDLGGMSDGMKAEVESEANDALNASISELSQGVPTATPTIRTGIMLMYMALRNKLDVATSGTDTLEIHNSAGTRIAQKLLTDDGSDYSEAKMSSGA